MDTSEQYIKMCEKAEGIQEVKNWGKGWMLSHGDFYITEYSGMVGPCIFPNGFIETCRCWLPRQDQLQGMVGCSENIQIAHHRLYQIAEFWVGRDLSSMEQLWLAFVMKENYNKAWNGENWVISD